MHMSLNATLPYELIDFIIDYLHDDRADLGSCCLVSKAWLASSRYHLFSDVLINYRNCDDILALPPPSIFTVPARRLMLADHDFLPPGIERFHSIKAFYLCASTPNADMINRIPLLFPTITSLELNQVVLDSFEHMVQLVCALPRLETLTLLMCIWNQELEPPAHFRLPQGLHTLNILSLSLHVFLDWFNALESMPPLATVRMYGVGEAHMTSVAATIKGLGGSLQHLTLALWDHSHADLLAESVDLSHSPNLRSFTLVNGWPKLLYRLLLTHTKQSKLEHLTLTMYEGKGNIPNLDLLDWGELDRLITAPRTSFRLMNLAIRVYAHRLVSAVDQAIVEGHFMPLCGAAGVVRFVSERERCLGVRQRMKGPISPRSWGEEISS